MTAEVESLDGAADFALVVGSGGKGDAPALAGGEDAAAERLAQPGAARLHADEREALEAVADPERAAQKRIAINQGKRKQKKRKLEKAKRTRDSGGSVGLGKRRRD